MANVFEPIPVQQGDLATAIEAINQNFRKIADQNRTRTVYDENGDSRILIGKGPKGNYILAVSKPGVDVIKALEK